MERSNLIFNALRWLRRTVFTAIGQATIGRSGSRIYCGGYCLFTGNTHVGVNANFNGMKILGSGVVSIGDNFHSGSGCEIITQNHNFEGQRVPYDDTYTTKEVVIGDNVWLGNRVTILPGVSIGEGAIIQAGSVVVSDIPECAIAGGHPAKVFSSRNREHYFELKKEGLFH